MGINDNVDRKNSKQRAHCFDKFVSWNVEKVFIFYCYDWLRLLLFQNYYNRVNFSKESLRSQQEILLLIDLKFSKMFGGS